LVLAAVAVEQVLLEVPHPQLVHLMAAMVEQV
jgi:hypothetical protein